MKKRINVMIDAEAYETVMAWLRPKGIGFSGYVNSLVVENVKAIKVLEGVNDLKDVSIGQLTQIYAELAEEMGRSQEKKKGRKGAKKNP